MAFWSRLGEKLSQTGQDMVKGTKDIAGTARVNGLIAGEQKSLETLYAQLGRRFYEQHPHGAGELYVPLFQAVSDSLTKIAGWQNELRRIRGIDQCPRCSQEMPLSAAFCSACGMEMSRPAPVLLASAARYCSQCGTPTSEGTAFCMSCGFKF